MSSDDDQSQDPSYRRLNKFPPEFDKPGAAVLAGLRAVADDTGATEVLEDASITDAEDETQDATLEINDDAISTVEISFADKVMQEYQMQKFNRNPSAFICPRCDVDQIKLWILNKHIKKCRTNSTGWIRKVNGKDYHCELCNCDHKEIKEFK